ncbi:hypothetical protein U1Q18_039366 [Sarracenia purpurea var. burkii]
MAARMSESEHTFITQALHMAIRALVAIPLGVPFAKPKRLAFFTGEPIAMEAICVPWPSASHDTGPSPTSLKLLASGQMPLSTMPTITSLANCVSGQRP